MQEENFSWNYIGIKMDEYIVEVVGESQFYVAEGWYTIEQLETLIKQIKFAKQRQDIHLEKGLKNE